MSVTIDPDDGTDQHAKSIQVATDKKLMLVWAAQNATGVRIEPLGHKDASGSASIPTSDATYSLVAVGADSESQPVVIEIHTHDPSSNVSPHVDVTVAQVVSFDATFDDQTVTTANQGEEVVLVLVVSDGTESAKINDQDVPLSSSSDGHKRGTLKVKLPEEAEYEAKAILGGEEKDTKKLELKINKKEEEEIEIEEFEATPEECARGAKIKLKWNVKGPANHLVISGLTEFLTPSTPSGEIEVDTAANPPDPVTSDYTITATKNDAADATKKKGAHIAFEVVPEVKGDVFVFEREVEIFSLASPALELGVFTAKMEVGLKVSAKAELSGEKVTGAQIEPGSDKLTTDSLIDFATSVIGVDIFKTPVSEWKLEEKESKEWTVTSLYDAEGKPKGFQVAVVKVYEWKPLGRDVEISGIFIKAEKGEEGKPEVMSGIEGEVAKPISTPGLQIPYRGGTATFKGELSSYVSIEAGVNWVEIIKKAGEEIAEDIAAEAASTVAVTLSAVVLPLTFAALAIYAFWAESEDRKEMFGLINQEAIKRFQEAFAAGLHQAPRDDEDPIKKEAYTRGAQLWQKMQGDFLENPKVKSSKLDLDQKKFEFQKAMDANADKLAEKAAAQARPDINHQLFLAWAKKHNENLTDCLPVFVNLYPPPQKNLPDDVRAMAVKNGWIDSGQAADKIKAAKDKAAQKDRITAWLREQPDPANWSPQLARTYFDSHKETHLLTDKELDDLTDTMKGSMQLAASMDTFVKQKADLVEWAKKNVLGPSSWTDYKNRVTYRGAISKLTDEDFQDAWMQAHGGELR